MDEYVYRIQIGMHEYSHFLTPATLPIHYEK